MPTREALVLMLGLVLGPGLGPWAGIGAGAGGAGVAAAQEIAAVLATDYNATAHVRTLALADPWPVGGHGEPVYHDAVGKWHGGLLYVVNRAGADNVQVLDPAQAMDTVAQYSLGLGRNLQDIGFASDGTAWVSCYDTAELLHVDPATGDILHVVSTAAFADADGLPETGWLLIHDDRVYLSCQRLDRDGWYAPVGDSYLLVLDHATRQWVDCDPALPGPQGILLSAPNPYGDIVVAGDRLLLGCVGWYGLQDGGVDVIDPTGLVSLGLEITEVELGGDLVDLDIDGDGRRCVVVADSDWRTRVKSYLPGSAPGEPAGPVTTLHSGTGYDHADLACDGDFQLFVADRRVSNPGLRVFDTVSGAQLTSAPVGTGLPPALVMIPRVTDPVGVPDGPGGPGDPGDPGGASPPALTAVLTMSAPWPNPANPATTIALRAPAGAEITLRVIDLRGRLVRTARITADPAGDARWTFDGRDHAGRAVPSGVYRCVAELRGGGAGAGVGAGAEAGGGESSGRSAGARGGMASGFAARSLTLVR